MTDEGKLRQVRYSVLQRALLAILLERSREAEPAALADLARATYRRAGKPPPAALEQAMAALVRATSEKVGYLSGAIRRTTALGRGVKAAYRLHDPKGLIRRSLNS